MRASGVRKLTFSDWVIKSWYARVVPKRHRDLLLVRERLDKSDIGIALSSVRLHTILDQRVVGSPVGRETGYWEL